MKNFLDPALLFFVFGLFAGLIKSNLEIPAPISRFLSLYLLMALGLKGGFALAQTGINRDIALSLGAAVALAIVIPLIGYQVLKRLMPAFDAAAVAATYGSVSAVTFITAVQFLDQHGIAYGGHMAAAMALMESPAIIIAVVLANRLRAQAGGKATQAGAPAQDFTVRKVLHESLTDGAQLLLLGAMLVGLLSGQAGKEAMQPFSVDLFKGMLAFFLLDMGLNAARNMPALRGLSPAVMAYAVVAPVLHALLALGVALALDLTAGNGGLLMVLAASASYIAVPAVVRHAIPEARPSLYFGLSLGITFPLNILFGIPAWIGLAQWALPA